MLIREVLKSPTDSAYMTSLNSRMDRTNRDEHKAKLAATTDKVAGAPAAEIHDGAAEPVVTVTAEATAPAASTAVTIDEC
jgi:hypothetical protein